jgi:uncharacterized protein (TIGR00251 family)
MRISVKVKPNSKQEKVEKLSDTMFIACVKSPAQEGKANAAVVKLLSEYFDIPKSTVIIARGHKGRDKIIDILAVE